MNIKVTVDYKSGYYYVTGFTEGPNGGKFSEIRKVISGTEDDGKVKFSYTDKKLMANRKRELKRAIRKILKNNPEFKVSKEALKKVDLLMFIALKRWDKQINNSSDYATKYLMSIIQKFDKNTIRSASKKVFEKKCARARADALRKAGIDITYNVGMINADYNLSVLDRIIGIRIAKIQQKFLNAKVINKVIVDDVNTVYEDRAIYENLPKSFDIPKDFEEKIIKETEEQMALQEKTKFEEEISIEDDSLDFDGEDDIVSKIAMNLERNQKEDEEAEKQEIRRKNEKRVRKTSRIINEEDDSLDFDGEDDIVSKIAMNLERNKKEDEEFDKQEIRQNEKRVRKISRIINEEDDSLDFEDEDDILSKLEMNLEKYKENEEFNEQEAENAALDTKESKIIQFKRIEKNEDSEQEEAILTSKTSDKIIPIQRGETKKTLWTRKIKNEEDSIRNKKFNPSKSNLKKRAVRIAIGILATGNVALAAYNVIRASDSLGRNNNVKIEHETEDTSDVEEMKNQIISNQNNLTKNKVQIEKQAEEKIKAQPIINVQAKIKNREAIKKAKQEKIEEFKQDAIQKYMDAFIIGEQPAVGDLLKGETYSASPDGSGNIGYFDTHSDYIVEHVTVITPDGYYPELTDGENLTEILNKYPDYTSYGIHFSSLKTNGEIGGGLGFVTKERLCKIINDKVDSIIKTRKNVVTKQKITQEEAQR